MEKKWEEWGVHVIEEQKRQANLLVQLLSLTNAIHIEFAQQKVKSSAWGFFGGASSLALMVVIKLFTG